MNQCFSRLIIQATKVGTLAIIWIFTSCSEHKVPTQVAVKVNSEEITIHQINNLINHAPGITEENTNQARKEILERLIDQQLAVQQAIRKKLDRSPEVVSAFEAQRRQILAQTYLQQLTSAVAKSDIQELRDYYSAHPELFAQRKIYNLREIFLQASEEIQNSILMMIGEGKNLDEIAGFLQQKKISFQSEAAVRGAEQLSMDIAFKFAVAKDGTVHALPGKNGILQIIQIAASRIAPVDFSTASPRIEQYLHVQKSNEIIKAEIQRLRAMAKIQYEGDFIPSSKPVAVVPSSSAVPKPLSSGEATQSQNSDLILEGGIKQILANQ